MSQNEDVKEEDANFTLDCGELNETVLKIFDGILKRPMDELTPRLEFIKENKFGAVWRNETERHEKVMSYANTFLQAITECFRTEHAEAAKHIEDSACDLFLSYVHDKLDKSLLGHNLFEGSCKKVHQSITRSILRIKDRLEKKHVEQPEQKSDLDDMISKTDLLDPIHIHHALLCCQVASDCKYPEHKQKSLEKFEKEHLLSDLYVSYENEQVPKYVMARCGNVLYVSFKGVQSHNLGRKERSYRGEICKGVSEAAQKIPLMYFAREIMKKKRIVFSGHSSGGAVAALVLVYLLEKFKHEEKSNFKCITFGLMPFADSRLKYFIRAIPGAQDCFCHIVQKDDIVPKLFGTFNMTALEGKFWELVQYILQTSLEFISKFQDPVFLEINRFLQSIIQFATNDNNILNRIAGFDCLDIFGVYFVLDTELEGQKYVARRAEQAAELLKINDTESLRNIQSQYLINHKLERYAHEVELIFTPELANLKNFKSTHSMEVTNDITPDITDVLFENIGDEIVAKIRGSGMWFVHHVSIKDVSGSDKRNLNVDVTKSTWREVQAGIQGPKFCCGDKVSVRVKTHFHNSKYLGLKAVSAVEDTYEVTRRQKQLAKHSPRAVIELACLSALLERCQESQHSKRFEAIRNFFESAVLVAPLESLFHAMANAKLDVMMQCCKIFCSCDTLSTMDFSSQWLLTSMECASSRITLAQQCPTPPIDANVDAERLPSPIFFNNEMESEIEFEQEIAERKDWKEDSKLLDNTNFIILPLLNRYKEGTERPRLHSPCNTDLGVIYPSADVKGPQKPNETRCKAPLNLLMEGKEELNQLSDDLIAENSDETANSNMNIKMLSVLNDLRKEFETCNTLLGAFMESPVQIPLGKAGGNIDDNKYAKHASSIGLSAWGLLILPFEFLNRLVISNLSQDFQQFVVEFSHHIRVVRNYMFPSLEHQFPDYDERLEFLVGSMKEGQPTKKRPYVSYFLERQLQKECENRHIFYHTSVDDILMQWNDIFEDEKLTLVLKEYRCLVARWIRWSLMINNLRESLASQTAVGVIGLVNSGKSKFVRSLFEKETITGTTDQKRTTVPLIYNMGEEIEGLDVIDFPGVDDSDESIPELAELLLSLTQIIIFVVEYKRVYTEPTKKWLSILEKEDVPVLICLTFADKLFAELMGENEDYDAEKVKLGFQKELDTIKKEIGEHKKRGFKFVVLAFDNDSNLNTEEGKGKLRKAGLSDELDVGRWIAQKFLEDGQEQISTNVFQYVQGKEKGTLNSNKSYSLNSTNSS